MNILFYIWQVVYLMLPGVFANMAPVWFSKINFLGSPIDGGVKFKGKPLLGKNKTYRGVSVAVIFAILIALLQRELYSFEYFRNLSLAPYDSISPIFWGILIGLGVMVGDMVESFFKRQRGIKSGDAWIPWDQTDSVIGALFFIMPLYQPGFGVWFTAIVLSLILHIGIRHLAYYLKINKEKW